MWLLFSDNAEIAYKTKWWIIESICSSRRIKLAVRYTQFYRPCNTRMIAFCSQEWLISVHNIDHLVWNCYLIRTFPIIENFLAQQKITQNQFINLKSLMSKSTTKLNTFSFKLQKRHHRSHQMSVNHSRYVVLLLEMNAVMHKTWCIDQESELCLIAVAWKN